MLCGFIKRFSLFHHPLRNFNTTFSPKAIIVSHQIPQNTRAAKEQPVRVDWREEVSSLSPEIKEEIAERRNSDPFSNTLSILSKHYGVSKRAIGAVAKLNPHNRERVISANIYKMNPSNNWKGPIHYRKVKTIQKERMEYDQQLEKQQKLKKKVEEHKENATIV